jgi:hypothetical protein
VKIEVVGAFAIGVLLPVLETCRRGLAHWGVEFTTMFEDYVAGALLLGGAWAALCGRRWGTLLLLVAWAYVTGLMSSSFWGQLEETIRQTCSEPNNLLVVVVKLVLWSAAVLGTALSFRSAIAASKP